MGGWRRSRLDPAELRMALAREAAPLRCAALEVGSRERPTAVLARRGVVVAALHGCRAKFVSAALAVSTVHATDFSSGQSTKAPPALPIENVHGAEQASDAHPRDPDRRFEPRLRTV